MTAMFDNDTCRWETLTEGDADEFLNRRPDPDDEDHDGEDETILAPVQPEEEVAVAVQFPTPNENVRCPCPPLEPYPDGTWLCLPQWELVATAEQAFGSARVRTRGAELWVPIDERLVRSWTAFEGAMAAGCGTFQPAFGGEVGTWIDLTPLGA